MIQAKATLIGEQPPNSDLRVIQTEAHDVKIVAQKYVNPRIDFSVSLELWLAMHYRRSVVVLSGLGSIMGKPEVVSRLRQISDIMIMTECDCLGFLGVSVQVPYAGLPNLPTSE
jgi:hypothetical protein